MTEEDVFSDAPPIVDGELLEAAKENVQPLATGRRVTALSSLLATPRAHRDSRLASTRNRLRINVEIAMGDEDEDPLDAYWNFVNWTLENYPQGHSAESGLLELLEEATRELKDHRNGAYRGELKYLKLWLLYASYVEKPTIIYRFLIANDIGTDLSLLYEEYSAVLERDRRRQEADDIYRLGIARRAQPLDHLKARHVDFEKRMMSAAPVPSGPLPTNPSTTTNPRLAPLATTVDRTSPPSARRPAPLAGGPTSNAPLPVFVDPTGSRSASALIETNAWPDVGTRKTRVKENIPQTKSMAGTKLKQSRRTASTSQSSASSSSRITPFRDPAPSASSRVVPFVDEDQLKEKESPAIQEIPVPATPKFTPFRDETVSAASPVAQTLPVDNVMKMKDVDADMHPEAEALRKDPLKNYGTEGLGFDDP